MNNYIRLVVPINPIPWKTPPFSVGRSTSGKPYVVAGKDQELAAYQDAVREVISAHPDCVMLEPPYMIQLWFSRRQDEYRTNTGRKSKQHEADVTNMQKATEDALQGVVIENDTNTVEIFSHTIEQGPEARGLVIIEVWGNWTVNIPDDISAILTAANPSCIHNRAEKSNAWPPAT